MTARKRIVPFPDAMESLQQWRTDCRAWQFQAHRLLETAYHALPKETDFAKVLESFLKEPLP